MRLPVLLLIALLAHPLQAERSRQISWSADVKRTLERARRENRPILVAINALDTEHGNRTMAFERYRDRDLVAATTPFLCLVASPSNHGKKDKPCTRFGAIRCDAHKEVIAWAVRKWGTAGNLVSPQHMILGPDGKLLWRREFWVDAAVLQRELEKALVKTAPLRALQLAAVTRDKRMKELRAGADAVAYLKSGDPLAPAVLLNLYEDDEDAKWLEPLKSASRDAFGLVRIYLEDDDALLPVARAIDPALGAWWGKFHRGKAKAPPPPHNPALAAAWKKLKAGDKKALGRLLLAFGHPVDGAEVRACLVHLVGDDLGDDPQTWREVVGR